jgi:hypothetical protein
VERKYPEAKLEHCSALGNFGMKNHLKTHGDDYKQFRGKDKAKAEKDASEVEETVQIFKLNSQKKRESIFQQTLPEWVETRNHYDFHDRRKRNIKE